MLLFAYLSVSVEWLKTHFTFQALNVLGALGVGVSAFVKAAYPATALEAAWILIAVVAVIRLLRKKPQPQ
ncbi:MAG: hypothetical protein Q7R81_00465 [Candidatus Peregrinibacteria bacterium]|nr:hypothetical protein [Candidatus Peregrinibacteria bacterium]